MKIQLGKHFNSHGCLSQAIRQRVCILIYIRLLIYKI